MELAGKVVLITGASRGIGEATATLFLEKGATVILTYAVSKEHGEKVHAACLQKGTCSLHQLDLRNDHSITSFVDVVKKKYEHIDILVNNAGAIVWKMLKDQSFEEIEKQLVTNLVGTIKLTKELLPLLHKEGMIINIASGAGKSAHKTLAPYCASKFGLRGFTQTLALEIPQKVFSVNPGMTKTRMTDFKGVPVETVAQVIISTAEESLGKHSGDDVDVWEYS